MEVMSGFYWDTGSREYNQDSILLEQVNTVRGRILLAAVSDGIGGLPEGEVASGFLMERLLQLFYGEIIPLIQRGRRRKSIGRSFARCLYETAEMLKRYGESREISLGATLSVLLLSGKQYFILHLGDSRIYEIRKGHMQQLTRDDRGEGNILTKCMGSFPVEEAYVRWGRCRKRTGFLLCSDGFFGRISGGLLSEMLDPYEIATQEQIRKRLSELGVYAKKQGEKDNLSAIYVLLKKEEEDFAGNTL